MTRHGADSTGSRLPSPSLGSLVNVLAIVVLIGVVAPFVVYSMPAVVGADHSFVVLSGSMEPEIAPGDVVVVSETTQQGIERGDVITFMRSDAEVPTTHRVIEVNEREDGVAYTTKGDANEDPDPEAVRPSQVIGEVTYTIPMIGYVVRFANTQTGFMLLIGLPLGLLIANEAWSILRAGNGETSTENSGIGVADSPAETTPAVTTAESVDADTVTGDQITADAVTDDRTTAEAATTESAGETPSTYTVTRSDLKLSMSILFVFAVYATWIALQNTSGVTVTAAVGAGAGVVICGAVYYAAGTGGSSSPPDESDFDGPGDGDGGGGDGHAGDDDEGGVASDTGTDENGAAGEQIGRETPADADAQSGDSGSISPATIGPPVVDSAESADSTATGHEATSNHGNEATNGIGVMDGAEQTGGSDDAEQTGGSDDAEQTSGTDDADREENR